MMILPFRIRKDINEMISALIRCALVNAQHYPIIKGEARHCCTVGFENDDKISIALGDGTYLDVYDSLLRNNVYSMRLLDGGLIQLSYSFADAKIIRHRLAFFPNPHVERINESCCDDEESEGMALMFLRRCVVPFPIRFDFNIDDATFLPVEHPRSHLTLGGFECCRIPVSSPIPPITFMRFILRNFYQVNGISFVDRLPNGSVCALSRTIDPTEQKDIYVEIG